MMIRATTVLTAAAAILVSASAARANFDRYYLSDTNWGVRVYQLPDMDQRRAELPGMGSNYCVPTAAMNAVAYAAQHGYPGIQTGVHPYTWWAYGEGYGAADGLLSLMGYLMGTDPSNGTNGNGGMTGLRAFLDSDDFMVMRYTSAGNGVDVTFEQLGQWARAGAIVLPCVGWYTDTEVTFREGGHCVTLAGAWRQGSQRVIAFRDPATDESPNNLNLQSTYKTSVYNCTPVTYDVILGGILQSRDFWRVDGMMSSGRIALLDSFYVILPYTGYTVASDGFSLKRIRPLSWSWEPSPPIETVASLSSAIRSMAIDPMTGFAHIITDPYVIFVNDQPVQIPSAVQSYDPSADLVSVEQWFTDAQRLVISRNRRFYVQDGANIRCLRYDDNDLMIEEAVAPLSNGVSSMCYDDSSDTLYVLTGPANQVQRFAMDLTPLPTIQIPPGAGLPGPTRSMAVNPTDGMLWLTSTSLNRLYRMDPANPTGTSAFFLPTSVGSPNDLNISDLGHVHLRSGTGTSGAIKVLEVNGTSLQLVPGAPFANLAAAGPLFIPHSMTNHDPATMEGPEYRNELPTLFDEGEADCVADLPDPFFQQRDGVVDVNDLLIVLGAWGPCAGGLPGCGGDITGGSGVPDGSIDVLDLLAVLGAWGACPQSPLIPPRP